MNWHRYRENLTVKLDALYAGQSTTPTLLDINDCIREVVQSPTIGGRHRSGQCKYKSVPWWDEECKYIVAQRKLAHTRYKRQLTYDNFVHYKNACARVRKLCNYKKREAWRSFTNSLQRGMNTTTLWNKINRIKGAIAPKRLSYHIPQDILMQFHCNYEPPGINQKPYENCHTIHIVPSIMDEPFILPELKTILHSIKKSSSPGFDNLSYRMYVELSNESKSILLNAYNNIWNTSNLPTSWTHHKIIPIPKRGVNNITPDNLRPIVLTSCSRKIYERLLLQRLQSWVFSSNILPNWQFAFIKGRGTMDCLSTIIIDIFLAFQRREYCCVAFIDLRSAYDLVDINILLQMLYKYKLSNKMIRTLQVLLTENTTQVVHKHFQTGVRIKRMGLIQGGILSPLLFNIFTIEVGKAIRQHARLVQYADDYAVYSANSNLEICVRNVQLALMELQQWTEYTGMEISVPKARVVIFSKRRRQKVIVSFNDVQIPQVNHTKFLGIILDDRLTFRLHIEDVLRRANNLKRIMRAMCTIKEGAHPEVLLSFYKATVRSLFDYGSPFMDIANIQSLRKLEGKQIEFLKMCFGLLKSTPNTAVLLETGENTLKFRRILLTTKFLMKQVTSAQLIHKVKLARKLQTMKRQYNNNHLPALLIALDLIDNRLENVTNLRQYPCFETPYEIQLRSTELFNPINSALLQTTKKYNMERKYIFQEKLQTEYASAINFYTDGSKMNSNAFVGAAVFCPELNISEGYSLPVTCSVFTSEVFAIRQALIIIREKNILWATIFSDSLSALQAINFTGWTVNEIWLLQNIRKMIYHITSMGRVVHLAWVPAHSNIPGNESVDAIAKAATTTGDKVYNILSTWQDNFTQIKSFLRSTQNREFMQDTRQSTYYSRHVDVLMDAPWFKCARYSRSEISLLIRVRTNHALTPHRLHLMKLRDNDICDCGYGRGDLNHIFLSCTLFEEERQQLFSALLQCGVQFPTCMASITALPAPKLAQALDRFTKKVKIKL